MPASSIDAALIRLWPNGDSKVAGLRAGIIASAPAVFAKYGITSNLAIAHLMAQISHECGAGTEVVENLNYSAQRMTEVWPSRFATVAIAAPYARNPQALANKVYNGRMGNRTGTDDGWNFRGRGAVQTTGREGYALLAKKTGLDLVNQPHLVNDPRYFLECGAADFIICGCLPYALRDDLLGVSSLLNVGHLLDSPKGVVGYALRKEWLAKWKDALNAAPPIVVSPRPSPPPPKPSPAPSPPPPQKAAVSFWATLAGVLAGVFKRNAS